MRSADVGVNHGGRTLVLPPHRHCRELISDCPALSREGLDTCLTLSLALGGRRWPPEQEDADRFRDIRRTPPDAAPHSVRHVDPTYVGLGSKARISPNEGCDRYRQIGQKADVNSTLRCIGDNNSFPSCARGRRDAARCNSRDVLPKCSGHASSPTRLVIPSCVVVPSSGQLIRGYQTIADVQWTLKIFLKNLKKRQREVVSIHLICVPTPCALTPKWSPGAFLTASNGCETACVLRCQFLRMLAQRPCGGQKLVCWSAAEGRPTFYVELKGPYVCVGRN
jgi:hypothetical protein